MATTANAANDAAPRRKGRPRVTETAAPSLVEILNLVRTEQATTRQEIERQSELGRAIVADRLNTLGDLYARVDKRAEAAACYRRVAEHYREQGFTLKAVAMYKKLTRHAPEDHQTALALAALYEQQGLMVDARQHYLIAAEALGRESGCILEYERSFLERIA